MRPRRDRRPRFVLDQNFPVRILSAAELEKWLPEFEIVSVRDHDDRLSKDFEDWQVILGNSCERRVLSANTPGRLEGRIQGPRSSCLPLRLAPPGSPTRRSVRTPVRRSPSLHTASMDDLSDQELTELETLTGAAAPAPWVAFTGPGLGGPEFIRLDGVDAHSPPDMYVARRIGR